MPVTVTTTTLTLPSYEPGPPDPEPPLRPVPGGRRPIYPYPTVERLSPTPTPRELKAVVFENEYLRLTFLPELNGRLYSVYDKLVEREVLYANPELKPALVGLRGVWYATGIEVNFPGSHTVTTANEVNWDIHHSDVYAEMVVWDTEAVSGMSWECRTRLETGTAAVDMETRLYNPTDHLHGFYFWVNAAFPVHPGSRYILPPSSRRIFTEQGMRPGMLGTVDYPIHDGVDLSLFENLHRHSSNFVTTPDEGFFGLHHPQYDTGVAHIADPNLVCGRKIWSWGFAPDGQLWHERLTDTGGPYCEVQSGPLRSQLEYRGLPPREMITQYERWLPLRGLGGLSFAHNDLALRWTRDGDALEVAALGAMAYGSARLVCGESETRFELGPEPVTVTVKAPDEATELEVVLERAQRSVKASLIPPPPRRAPRLKAVRGVTPGQRGRYLEWAGRRPEAEQAYREGAEDEVIAAVGMARLALLRDESEQGAKWARRALNLDWHDPEALWVAAVAARDGDDPEDAVWYLEELLGHPPYRDRAQAGLIESDLIAGRLIQADERCWRRFREASTTSFALRDGRAPLAGRLCHGFSSASLEQDWTARVGPLYLAERYLAHGSPLLAATAQLAAAETLHRLGDTAAALDILAAPSGPAPGTPLAMLDYAAAYLRNAPPENVRPWTEGFAHGAFAIRVLKHAVTMDEGDLLARYHLGNALAAANDWDTACSHWAVAAEGPNAPEANRNLGLAAWKLHDDREAALACYEYALYFGAGPRTLAERDELLAEMGRHEGRLEVIEAGIERHPDDTRLPLRRVAALLDLGRHEEAVELLRTHEFQLYEGGYYSQALWRRAQRELAEAALAEGRPADAAERFQAAASYPPNLGVGEPAANPNAELWYLAGQAWAAAGDEARAEAAWRRGADPGRVLRSDDQPYQEIIPEGPAPRVSGDRVRRECYRARCLFASGDSSAAAALLDELTQAVEGEAALEAEVGRVRAEG